MCTKYHCAAVSSLRYIQPEVHIVVHKDCKLNVSHILPTQRLRLLTHDYTNLHKLTTKAGQAST